jgi:hypothetical protein
LKDDISFAKQNQKGLVNEGSDVSTFCVLFFFNNSKVKYQNKTAIICSLEERDEKVDI